MVQKMDRFAKFAMTQNLSLFASKEVNRDCGIAARAIKALKRLNIGGKLMLLSSDTQTDGR